MSESPDPNMERTLVLIKPDGVRRGLVGEVISRIEARQFVIEKLRLVTATRELLKKHYCDLTDKPFFPGIADYMVSGPTVAMVISGDRVIEAWRAMCGVTDPVKAAPGTIRGDFARTWGPGPIHNIVHGSDSPESAEREIGLWFPGGAL